MGWFSDFVSNPIDTIGNTVSDVASGVGDVVSGAGNAVGDVVNGVGNAVGGAVDSIGNTLSNINFSDPATLAAIAATAYGFSDPEMFASLGSGGAETAGVSGLDLGGAGAGADTWGSTLADTSAGQASNIATGASLQPTGYLGMQGTAAGSSGMLGTSVGYGAGGEGLTAPAATTSTVNPVWSGSVTPAANAPFSLSDLGTSIKNLGASVVSSPLKTALVGSSLYDMYAKNQMAKAQQQRYDQQQAAVNNFYAPGTPEYNQLVEGMKRSAVAAGRPIDSAQFAGDIAGKIADKKMSAISNMSTGQNALLQSTLGSQYGGLNSLFNNMALYTQLAKKGLV